MVLKASAAAFFTSIISNKLIVTSTITQFLAPVYDNLQVSSKVYTFSINLDKIETEKQ